MKAAPEESGQKLLDMFEMIGCTAKAANDSGITIEQAMRFLMSLSMEMAARQGRAAAPPKETQ